jgi:hypothetical protein
MKAVSNSHIQKSNTSRKADVKLTLSLTADQAERLAILAKMVNTTPEALAVAQIFAGLDGSSSWGEFVEAVDNELWRYTEEPRDASDAEPGLRLEDGAPARMQKMAGYTSPEGTFRIAQ